jgi:hypothetical protein
VVLQVARAAIIPGLVAKVRLSVYLNDYPALMTCHVCEEGSDRMLPTELESRKTAAAQMPP